MGKAVCDLQLKANSNSHISVGKVTSGGRVGFVARLSCLINLVGNPVSHSSPHRLDQDVKSAD